MTTTTDEEPTILDVRIGMDAIGMRKNSTASAMSRCPRTVTGGAEPRKPRPPQGAPLDRTA
jgi:hypothetical protein